MDVLGTLRKLGDRLGIIELSVTQGPSTPLKIQTRAITMDELMTLHIKDVRKFAEHHADLRVSFEEIFKAAGIQTPSGGWTIDRLQEFLNSDRIRSLGRAEVQREMLQALAADKADAADVVKDAVLRDQALDAFADFTFKKRERWLEEKEAEIQELKDKQKNLEQQIAASHEQWNNWRSLKRERERDMAHAVAYLVDKPVISIDEE